MPTCVCTCAPKRETPGQSERHFRGLHTEGWCPSSAKPHLLNLPRVVVINNPTWELKVSQALDGDHGRRGPSLGQGLPMAFHGEVKGSYQMQQVSEWAPPTPYFCTQSCEASSLGFVEMPPGRSVKVGACSPHGPARPSELHTLPDSAILHPRRF